MTRTKKKMSWAERLLKESGTQHVVLDATKTNKRIGSGWTFTVKPLELHTVDGQDRFMASEEISMRHRKKMTRLDNLREMLPKRFTVYTNSPGDGQTRYRFFENAPKDQSYFGPHDGIYTALGYGEAVAFAKGLGH